MAKGNSSASKTAVWILLGLLVISLAGFSAGGLGGTIRTVGSVGDKPITVNQYFNTLQQELRALNAQSGQTIPFTLAQQIGVPERALAQIVTQRALDNEASELGLSVGDEVLQEQILSMPAFQGLDGSFDETAYRFALDNAGLSVQEFENSLREDAARTLLQGAVLGGSQLPDTYADTLVSYVAERRNATVARLTVSDLTDDVPEPTEADVQGYYEDNQDAYMLPEARQITFAWLSPDMVLGEIAVEEDLLRASYEERNAEFNTPERRLVERLVFLNDADASAAKERLDAAEVTFESLVEERGLTLADIDLGDLPEAALGDAGSAVFAAETGDVVGPVQSDLGPALFRINGVLAAQNTSFEQARAQIRDELAADRARRLVEAQASDIDDLLAGGATLEDLGTETDMQLGTVDWSASVSEGIAGYEAFRARAASVTQDDFPAVELLADGGIFALRLDDIVAPRPQPLEDVTDRVKAAWQSAEVRKTLRAQAEDLETSLTGDADWSAAGLTAETVTDLTRTGFQPDMPPPLLSALFEAETGAVVIVEDGSTVLVARVDAVLGPDEENEDVATLRDRLTEQGASTLGQDLFDAFATDIQNRAGINIDQSAINAVHVNFQ